MRSVAREGISLASHGTAFTVGLEAQRWWCPSRESEPSAVDVPPAISILQGFCALTSLRGSSMPSFFALVVPAAEFPQSFFRQVAEDFTHGRPFRQRICPHFP